MKIHLQLLSILVSLALAGSASVAQPSGQQSKTTPGQTNRPSSPGAGVTLSNYMQLKKGMRYAEVVKILGREGTNTGSGAKHSQPGTKVAQYLWEGEGGGSMTVLFENNKLISKAQSGLK